MNYPLLVNLGARVLGFAIGCFVVWWIVKGRKKKVTTTNIHMKNFQDWLHEGEEVKHD